VNLCGLFGVLFFVWWFMSMTTPPHFVNDGQVVGDTEHDHFASAMFLEVHD